MNQLIQTRFVLLRHYLQEVSGEGSHFDLMIEDPKLAADEYSLTTWQLPRWPFVERQLARQIPPHRVAWLDREGPVSGGRGHARRVCRGLCDVFIPDTDVWKVRFQTVDLIPEDAAVADTWPGRHKEVELVFTKCTESNSDDRWQVSVG